MGPRLRRAVVLLPVLALLASACVSRADGPSPAEGDEFLVTTTSASSTTDTADLASSLTAFRSCLDDLGVVIDEIEIDGRGRPLMGRAMAGVDFTDRQTLDALGECAPIVTTGALDTGTDPGALVALTSALELFAECVRGQGVDEFPDPMRGFDGVGGPFNPARVPWADPALQDAVAVCSERMRATSR